MTPTATDYAWFAQDCAALAEAYCLTLAAALTPREVVDRLGGTGPRELAGLGAVVEPGADASEEDEEFVAVAALPGWALIVEPFGYLGVTEDVAAVLSRGTRLVAHYRNIVGGDQFLMVEDGEVRLDFAPSDPADGRLGAHAGAVAAAGFDRAPAAAALALAEHLTGVRLTRELLENAVYLCADVPEPE
jgi:Family of unknown function (DUF6461)